MRTNRDRLQVLGREVWGDSKRDGGDFHGRGSPCHRVASDTSELMDRFVVSETREMDRCFSRGDGLYCGDVHLARHVGHSDAGIN